MVNIAWLGEPDDRMYKHVGLPLTCSADSQLTVGTMHGIASLDRQK